MSLVSDYLQIGTKFSQFDRTEPINVSQITSNYEYVVEMLPPAPSIKLNNISTASSLLQRLLKCGEGTTVTIISRIGGVPRACSVSGAAGWQPAKTTEILDYQLFKGVIVWENPVAKTEYEELFRLSCESYELSNHKLLAAGGVKSQFLALQCEQFWSYPF